MHKRVSAPLWLTSLLELALIILWAIFAGRALLVFSPLVLPGGVELPNLIQPNFFWADLQKCGLCFLWNGFINGGAPAFAELSGAVLHPLVFLPALLWGVVDGSKVTVIASLALAGIGQWLIARKLGLSVWARLWTGFLAVVAGFTAGKMVDGMYTTTLGIASASLVAAFAIDLLHNRNRRALPGLALGIALVFLAGSGYTQVGLIVGLLPGLGLFCWQSGPAVALDREAVTDYLLAMGLALMLAGTFLIPLVHFLSQMEKGLDASLVNLPRLEYAPLSLVIRDPGYYAVEVLGKDTYASAHMLYIGWLPVLLAPVGLLAGQRAARWAGWVLALAAAWLLVITSVDFIKPLAELFPALFTLRHFALASGLAGPLILALAGRGLDRAITALSERVRLRALRFGLVALAAVAILPVYQFTQPYLQTWTMRNLSAELDNFSGESNQWLRTPGIYDWETGTNRTQSNMIIREQGMFDWTIQAEQRGLKIGDTWRPWQWKGRTNPPVYLIAETTTAYSGAVVPFEITPEFLFAILPAGEYAILENEPDNISPQDRGEAIHFIPCAASGQGGRIDVTCPPDQTGHLTVHENNWNGWRAWVDGHPVPLLPGRWLQIDLPPGAQTVSFRYWPWDVAVGLLVTLIGGGVALWMSAVSLTKVWALASKAGPDEEK